MKKETYYICSECGELTTQSRILQEIEASGGSGMCLCEFTRPVWNEKYDDLDVETPRIMNPYIEISKRWYDIFMENKDTVWRLKAFRHFHIKLKINKSNKERIKELFSDGKRRKVSDVAEELNIPPREVVRIFHELDEEGFFEDDKN